MREKIIFIPGLFSGKSTWQYQMEHLSNDFDCETIVISDECSIPAIAKKALLLTPEKFHLVGHSMGGLIAMQMALLEPDRILSLTLASPWSGTKTEEFLNSLKTVSNRIRLGELHNIFHEFIFQVIHPERVNDKVLTEHIWADLRAYPITGLLNHILVLISAKDIHSLLDHLTAPTLIIHGTADNFFTLEQQQLLQKSIPKSSMTTIENCGHMIQLEKPETVSSLIQLWVKMNST